MILTPWTLEVSHGLKQAMAIRLEVITLLEVEGMILKPWTLEVSHGLKQAMAIRDVKWFKTSYGRTFW